MPALQFGLNLSKKSQGKTAATKTATAFGGDSDSEQESNEPSFSSKGTAKTITSFSENSPPHASVNADLFEVGSNNVSSESPKSKRALRATAQASAPSLSSARSAQAMTAAAQEIDATIFDYDEHYDTTSSAAMQAAKRSAAREDAQTRTPRYMTGMQAAASIRKRDQTRARDRLLQKEREAEGDDVESEKFVTEAYKAQQEELRQAEDEERQKEEAEAERRRKAGGGMSGFWKGMMKDEDERLKKLADDLKNHERDDQYDKEAVLTGEEQERRDAERARELNAQGADIVLTEEGQVADKRQLLTGGLNITSKARSPASPSSTARHNRSNTEAGFRHDSSHRGSQRAVAERHSRMLETQLASAAKRRADDEAESVIAREKASKSQKTEKDVQSARERFLQRKRDADAAKSKDHG